MNKDIQEYIQLLRRYPVEEAGDDGEYDVRQPECYGWRKGVGVNEHLAELEEEDVGKCQGYTDTDVPPDSSTTLL